MCYIPNSSDLNKDSRDALTTLLAFVTVVTRLALALGKAVLAIGLLDLYIRRLKRCSNSHRNFCHFSAVIDLVKHGYARIEAAAAASVERVRKRVLIVADSCIVVEWCAITQRKDASD